MVEIVSIGIPSRGGWGGSGVGAGGSPPVAFDTFDDYFQSSQLMKRGGGFWDVTAPGACNRLGGLTARHPGDLVGYLPNLAPSSLGSAASLLTLATTSPGLSGSAGGSAPASSVSGSGGTTGSSGTTGNNSPPGNSTSSSLPASSIAPLPPALRWDLQYLPDLKNPQHRQTFPTIPMIFPSEDWFRQLAADTAAKNAADGQALLSQMGVLAAWPGVTLNRAPGLTFALVGALSTSEFSDADSQVSAGSAGTLNNPLPLTPGVMILTVDFSLATQASPSAPPAQGWQNGVPLPTASLGTSISWGPTFTPEQLLTQFLLANGQFSLMAGLPCIAVQKVLLLSRPITNSEAQDITKRLQAAMEHASL